MIKTEAEIQKLISEYTSTLHGKNKEELEKIEQDVIAEIDKKNDEIKNMTFPMDKANRKEVCRAVCYLLNEKETVQFQYGRVLLNLYNFWANAAEAEEVNYPTFNLTMDRLGSLQLKGHKEWEMSELFLTYFKDSIEKYAEAQSEAYILSQKHSAVMNAMGLFETESQTAEE